MASIADYAARGDVAGLDSCAHGDLQPVMWAGQKDLTGRTAEWLEQKLGEKFGELLRVNTHVPSFYVQEKNWKGLEVIARHMSIFTTETFTRLANREDRWALLDIAVGRELTRNERAVVTEAAAQTGHAEVLRSMRLTENERKSVAIAAVAFGHAVLLQMLEEGGPVELDKAWAARTAVTGSPSEALLDWLKEHGCPVEKEATAVMSRWALSCPWETVEWLERRGYNYNQLLARPEIAERAAEKDDVKGLNWLKARVPLSLPAIARAAGGPKTLEWLRGEGWKMSAADMAWAFRNNAKMSTWWLDKELGKEAYNEPEVLRAVAENRDWWAVGQALGSLTVESVKELMRLAVEADNYYALAGATKHPEAAKVVDQEMLVYAHVTKRWNVMQWAEALWGEPRGALRRMVHQQW